MGACGTLNPSLQNLVHISQIPVNCTLVEQVNIEEVREVTFYQLGKDEEEQYSEFLSMPCSVIAVRSYARVGKSVECKVLQKEG